VTTFLGYAVWLWVVHRWAVSGGRNHLLEGDRPLYLAVAGITYFPVPCCLWLLAFPRDGRLAPWAEEEKPLRSMGETEAEALAQVVRDGTGLQVSVRAQGAHFVVDVDTPATRHRLTREEQWPDLRRRLGGRRRP